MLAIIGIRFPRIVCRRNVNHDVGWLCLRTYLKTRSTTKTQSAALLASAVIVH